MVGLDQASHVRETLLGLDGDDVRAVVEQVADQRRRHALRMHALEAPQRDGEQHYGQVGGVAEGSGVVVDLLLAPCSRPD